MPRVSTSLILQAYQQDRLLPLLLQGCRCLESAKNELRWLRRHATRTKNHKVRVGSRQDRVGWRSRLREMCRERAKGKPLQYILGDQPFGDLQILCRKGVLIPRPSTELYTLHSADVITAALKRHDLAMGFPSATQGRPLRVLDLCTGTGCIALLLHALLAPQVERMFVLGIDISEVAVALARRNLRHNLELGFLANRASAEIRFRRANVLDYEHLGVPALMSMLHEYKELWSTSEILSTFSLPPRLHCDVLISNPPYISAESLQDGTTERSVRKYEPILALTPAGSSPSSSHFDDEPRHEDTFYRHILQFWIQLQPSLTILECGDLAQAERVARIYRDARSLLGASSDYEVSICADEGLDAGPDAVPGPLHRAVVVNSLSWTNSRVRRTDLQRGTLV